MGKIKLGGVLVGCVVGLCAGRADAGSVTLDSGAVLGEMTDAQVVVSANAAVAVYEYGPAGNNPEGISVGRGAGHSIPRSAPGKPLRLGRAVGDAAGSVFLWYRAYNDKGGIEGRVRRVSNQNQATFDRWLPISTAAGIAADGADGVYVASHKPYAKEGEVWMTMTAHTTYRLGPTGEVIWQVAEAGARTPFSDSEMNSCATRSAQGVFVGHGIIDAQNRSTPVLIHRNAADGSARYVRVGLTQEKKSTSALLRRAGVPGGDPLPGHVHEVFVASDGTAIASVVSGHDPTIVRVDANGVQTAVYECGPDGEVLGHANGEVSCVHGAGDGAIGVERYAINNGNLALVRSYKTAAKPGWEPFSSVALPGGELLTGGRANGKTIINLFSPAGAPLGAAGGLEGFVTALGAANGKYVGVGPATAPQWQRSVGSYDVTPPPVTPSPRVPTIKRLPL
jgi:hypothetical protein